MAINIFDKVFGGFDSTNKYSYSQLGKQIFRTFGGVARNAINYVGTKLGNSLGNIEADSGKGFVKSTAKNVVNSANSVSDSLSNIKKAYTTSAVKSEALNNNIANSLADSKSLFAFQQSQSSAQKQMDFQREQADLAWERSQSSAQKQMDFQREMWQKSVDYNTEMSNTSYQRAVADLRKAGLNPILAVTQGGASTPTASVPSGASSSAQAMSGASATFPVANTYKEDYAAISEDKNINWLDMIASVLGSSVSSALKTFFMGS